MERLLRVTGWPLDPQALNGPTTGALRLVEPMVRVAEVESVVTQSNSCGVPVRVNPEVGGTVGGVTAGARPTHG